MAEKEKTVGLLINMPKSLKDDFQGILERNGSSMNAVVRILIAEYLVKMKPLDGVKPKKVLRKKR